MRVSSIIRQKLCKAASPELDTSLGLRRGLLRRIRSMRNRPYTFAYVVLLMLGTAGLGVAQDGGQQPTAREQLQHIHTSQSIDQKLASLTKDLELTPKQRRQVRPLLQEHHDKIQA